MVVDKYAGRCLDVGSTPTGSIFFIHGRLLKRLKRPCWKRGRRVTACVGSNPMSSVEKKNYFGDTTKMLYPLLYPFFTKDCQGIPKTKIKNVDLTTFYQGMQKNAKE